MQKAISDVINYLSCILMNNVNINDFIIAHENATKPQVSNNIHPYFYSNYVRSLLLSQRNKSITTSIRYRKPTTDNSYSSRCRSGYSSFFIYRQEQQDRQREKTESQPNLIIEYEPTAYPDIYCPAKRYQAIGIGNWITRKYLRVGIRNEGGGVASQCNARLRILNNNTNFSPSLEPKTLQWDSKSINEDIGVKNFAILDVVFSDSIEREKKAFVSTPFNLDVINILDTKIEDGFHVGDYEFELVVKTIDGISVTNNFKVHVTDKWDEISMEKID
jgi:hypothetical protein